MGATMDGQTRAGAGGDGAAKGRPLSLRVAEMPPLSSESTSADSTNNRIKLISTKGCSGALQIATVLHKKSAQFEYVVIDLEAKPDWFDEINPLGTVPIIQHRNDVINHSGVICEYLDEMLPKLNGLSTADPYLRAV